MAWAIDTESAFLTARKLFDGFIVAASPCCGAIDVGPEQRWTYCQSKYPAVKPWEGPIRKGETPDNACGIMANRMSVIPPVRQST